jgi:hypothetical protein
MDAHYRTYGDMQTPLGLHLTRADDDGEQQDYDVTGLTVKVAITDASDGSVVVAETTTGITVVTASEGKVSYDFQGGANLLPEGEYLVWIRVYDGTEFDTFPVYPDEMRVIITDPLGEST